MPTLRTAPTWLARFATAGSYRQGGACPCLCARPERLAPTSGRDDPEAGRFATGSLHLLASLADDARVFGDATRGGDWAPRLGSTATVVAADAPGLERPLAGLTLLEAAASAGEPLAVEALASAIGQVFRAEPAPGRVAVAMSGGVDSAVALLRAGQHAIGVTLRLWQDPAAPDTERACCSPAAVAAARATCHALGLPHVTLDLREEFKGAIVDPFTRAYERGRRRIPACAATVRSDSTSSWRFAERAGAEELWTGHYARIVERDGMTLVARARDESKDQSYMLAAVDPALLERVRFPLGDQTKEETRAEAARARARGCATRGESGGVLPRWGRLPRVPRAPGATGARPAQSSTPTARRSARTTATGASRRGSGVVSASPPTGRSTCWEPTPRRTP